MNPLSFDEEYVEAVCANNETKQRQFQRRTEEMKKVERRLISKFHLTRKFSDLIVRKKWRLALLTLRYQGILCSNLILDTT